MDKKVKLNTMIWSLLRWPVIMAALMVAMNILVYTRNVETGVIVSGFVIIYVAVMGVVFITKQKKLKQELVRYGINYGQVQRKLQDELDLPYAVTDNDGNILWFNKGFSSMVGGRIRTRQPIHEFFEQLDRNAYPKNGVTSEATLAIGESTYQVKMTSVSIENFSDDNYWNSEKRMPHNRDNDELVCVYFYDITENTRLKRQLSDEHATVGFVYIDNYEETLESIDSSRRSMLTALVDRRINKFFQNYDSVLKMIEKDKYIVFIQNQYLEDIKQSKFPVLDEVRGITISGNESPFSISIGIGAGAESYNRSYEAARAAMDLALGRGGDQVVVKYPDSVEYFGGKTNSVERNTRVKARVKAQALRELIEAKDKVLVMGHVMPDADAFGSAVGIYRIASYLNKEVHIVMEEVNKSLAGIVSRFTDNDEYTGMIITPKRALEMVDPMTLVVVVDVNRPSRTECPELLDKSKSVVVLDHHRRTDEAIENAALSYVESAASSACEVVSEIVQYISDDIKLKPVEADALYAGMMVDSNNFLNKTGIRTFEAAAFLRRNNADAIRIRKLFRTDINEYAAKAKAIAGTELFLNCYAIATCDALHVDSPTVLGAQVANELMDVKDIRASFVFTEYNKKIYVSARSIDEVNVQVVMEKLGGGGHMSVAGVQFENCTVTEAIDKVKGVLKSMTEGGDI